MPQSSNETPKTYSRRAFIRRAALSLGAMTAATLAAGGGLLRGKASSRLPEPGSIFAPRRQDLLRHWQQKVSRFRLR